MPEHRHSGDTTRNGYGAHHQALRRQWAPIVAAGTQPCACCGQPIQRGQPWDLGHEPGTHKQAYRGPEHRACNRATAQERAAGDPQPTPRTHW